MRLLKIAAVVGVVLLVGAFALGAFGTRRVPDGQPALARLRDSNLDELRAVFNAHAGETRLIVLLAPT